jgi:dipeptidyl aminopeptidase/acylaminoacyl peptidase
MYISRFFWTKRIIVYGGIILILLVWKLSSILIKTPRDYNEWKPSSFGLVYSNVEFKTDDNILIKGWFIPNKTSKATIIFLHGLGTNRSDMTPKVPFLYHAGYNILLFDLRAHGESEGKYTTLGYHEVKDLIGAVKYLSEKPELDSTKIGVYGISMGASIAINGASKDHRIKAVVADSTFANAKNTIAKYAKLFSHIPKYPLVPLVIWISELRAKCRYSDVDPIKQVSNVSPTALFLIHGEIDERVHFYDSRDLYEKAKDPKEIWIVQNAGHVGAYAYRQREYEKRVVEFFDKHLK